LIAFRTTSGCSPFGGIPRNWKRYHGEPLPCVGIKSSPFGGIPRNWKRGRKLVCSVRSRLFPLRGDP